MKKVFTLLTLLVCVLTISADEIEVVLDRTTAQNYGQYSPFLFKSGDNGVEMKVTCESSQLRLCTGDAVYGLNQHILYYGKTEYTITVPVNFIVSKITFKGLTDGNSKRTSLVFDNNEAQEFAQWKEDMTTCEYTWPEGKTSAKFHGTDTYENLALIITLTGELKPYYATMAKNGFSTFCADKQVKTNGVTIYGTGTVKESTENVYTIEYGEKRNSIVPAEMGVILQGEPGKTYFFEENNEYDPYDYMKKGNTLKPALTATKVDNNYTFVLICNKNNDAQFARLKSGSTIPAGKAYLEIPELATNSVSSLSLYFADPTGIHEVKANNEADDNYYSLDGKRLSARPDHGTYIHKGHVYMAK